MLNDSNSGDVPREFRHGPTTARQHGIAGRIHRWGEDGHLAQLCAIDDSLHDKVLVGRQAETVRNWRSPVRPNSLSLVPPYTNVFFRGSNRRDGVRCDAYPPTQGEMRLAHRADERRMEAT